MNKRGALFHWILFGMVGAIALFYALTANIETNVAPKGAWALSFLENNYYPSQREALLLELTGAEKGKEIVAELAAKGGFDPREESECGLADGTVLWNKGDTSCFPDAAENAKGLLQSGMPEFEFEFAETFLIGKGATKSTASAAGTYFYREEFAVDLGYDFREYGQLIQEAQFLLTQCADAAACVSEKKPAHWHYQSCAEEIKIPESQSEMVFCVESPAGYKIKGQPVQYVLALDFGGGK